MNKNTVERFWALFLTIGALVAPFLAGRPDAEDELAQQKPVRPSLPEQESIEELMTAKLEVVGVRQAPPPQILHGRLVSDSINALDGSLHGGSPAD